MSSNVVALPSGPERRKRNLFGGVGKHRRTPEAWEDMRVRIAASESRAAQAEARADRLERERDQAVANNRQLEQVVDMIQGQMLDLRGEVQQLRTLMGPDVHNQETVTIIPPSDPEETQPISQAELFSDDPIKPLRPVIRVGTIGAPKPSSSGAATQLLQRLSSQSEKVPHIDVTQPIPLWDSPLAQAPQKQRHTA